MIRTILTLNASISSTGQPVTLKLSADDILAMSRHEPISSLTSQYVDTGECIDIFEPAIVTNRTNINISISTKNHTYTLFTV